MSIEISHINKRFENFTALSDINLTIPDGELVALLGPSGSGKTTLLRIIAGLEEADSGTIYFNGEDTTATHVRDRGVGFVFQHYALFRHMSVFENVAFGLRVRPKETRPSEEEIKERVHKLLKLIQLDWIANRYPSQLSGGQRQRVALARALAVEPKVLLLDEPFGALDAKVRKELRRWLRHLHDELHITSIFVTHDQEEALEVADQIVVMNKGNIEQIGSPREVYEKPATPFVFDFLGHANRFEGEHQHGKLILGEDRLDLAAHHPQGSLIAFARPHELSVYQHPVDNAIQATFVREVWVAGKVFLELQDRQGKMIEAVLSAEQAKLQNLQANQTVWVKINHLHLFEHHAA